MKEKFTFPDLSLVVLIGASGSGKSTFARKHFLPTEVISSDYCRALVSDDENDLAATNDAFEVLHFIAAKRLASGRLTVVDATNVKPEDRKSLIELARQYHSLPVAIVLNVPERICQDRNKVRTDRRLGTHVAHRQLQSLHRSLRGLDREGFRHVLILASPEEAESIALERVPLYNNKRSETGPFDIIGDIHGCYDELGALLTNLGYTIPPEENAGASASPVLPPDGRKVVFLGDLVDRGPNSPGVLRLVMQMVAAGHAYCVPGNHDIKLLRKLRGRDVQLTHGIVETLRQLEKEPPEFRVEVASFLDALVSHYVFDGGRLVVAHAGMKEEMQGRGSGKVRDFALFGETTGEVDEFGLQVRYNWAADYRGNSIVVYGHTPVPEPEWLNRTINIDTGCVFGGKLTALRYPEKEIVSVPARNIYYAPVRPLQPPVASDLSAQHAYDDLLDLEDVIGKRFISTRLHQNITIPEENAMAALEVMSRFASNPKWLIYLPPTMSPTETTREPGLLEHPAEAFAYFRHEGVPSVVCEEKHMGSRAVVVVCRDQDVARKRFGVIGEGIGLCYTRTGRRFFDSVELEAQFLDRLRGAANKAALWDMLKTDWVCLDAELMPWSAKAQELLRRQYAPVGASARGAFEQALVGLDLAAGQDPEVARLRDRVRHRASFTDRFIAAYRRYCWSVQSLDDLKLAPFHLLASEGRVYFDRDHLWHMETLAALCAADPQLLLATKHRRVDLVDAVSQQDAIAWWSEHTDQGGEGMVVKPFHFIEKGRRGIVQPAVKCRGREYLRIIYGPEYTLPVHLDRLRSRGLGRKRSLAQREFALGVEALERFVRNEPLRRVHECVFGVLALESEPVDPRL
jgi:protein phosphatase